MDTLDDHSTWLVQLPADDGAQAADPVVAEYRHGIPGEVIVSAASGIHLPRGLALRIAGCWAEVVAARPELAGGGRPPRSTVVLGPADDDVRATPLPEGRLGLDVRLTDHGDVPDRASLTRHLAAMLDAASHEADHDNAATTTSAAGDPGPTASSSDRPFGTPEILTFKNLWATAAFGSTNPDWIGHFLPGSLNLVSALRRAGIPVRVSAFQLHYDRYRLAAALDALETELAGHPGVNAIFLSVMETDLVEIRALTERLARATDCWIVIGGQMPTDSPQQAFVHVPAAHVLLRGLGDDAGPQLARILGDSRPSTGLSRAQMSALSGLPGLLVHHGATLLSIGLDQIHFTTTYDPAYDVDLLDRGDLSSFVKVMTSRGCAYDCAFCSTFPRRRHVGQSPESFERLLIAYRQRLEEHFAGEPIPSRATAVDFRDSDLLFDRDRAVGLLQAMREQGFTIWDFQVSVRSLARGEHRLASALDLLTPDMFHPQSLGPSVGSEAFCDSLLQRYGKGCSAADVFGVAAMLARRGIAHTHYSILTHQDMDEREFWDNLTGACELLLEHWGLARVSTGGASLIPFFGTAIHRQRVRAGTLNLRRVSFLGQVPGYSEFDYPCMLEDIPASMLIRQILPPVQALLSSKHPTPMALVDGLDALAQRFTEMATSTTVADDPDLARSVLARPDRTRSSLARSVLTRPDLDALLDALPDRLDALREIAQHADAAQRAQGQIAETTETPGSGADRDQIVALAPLRVGQSLQGWTLARIDRDPSRPDSVVAVFRRADAPGATFRFGIAPRDDARPRATHTERHNLYVQMPSGAQTLSSDANQLLAALVELVRRNDS